MALSYCWGPIDGTSKLLKTTHETLASRREKIAVDTMPQTFQDAIIIARTLGIQYLWIDSLCIIQDDSRDWQIESSKMAEIFSNAYLTLISASGSGCNDSFLSQYLAGLSCTIPVDLNPEMAIQGQFSIRLRRFPGSSDKMAEILTGKWISRGWTFQEERLARRVLMFGENKYFFDCRTFEQAQDTDKRGLRPNWATAVASTKDEIKFRKENVQLDNHWEHWQTLCRHYAYRELTFPEDKLPAISGMASKMAMKVQSEYLAGLWKDNLMHDLFWETGAVTTKLRKYRAPSWSWVSLDGVINWPLWRTFASCSECTTYCDVLDVRTTPNGLDPYGAVKDGFLKVRGRLQEVKVLRVGESKYQHPGKLYQQGIEIGSANFDRGIESNSNQVHSSEEVYQGLLMAECNSSEDGEPLIRGLVLAKNGRKREGHDELERVGTFTLPSGGIPDEWNSDAEQVVVII
ncbi:HET-domain-containing protein [Mollisia scopiformis]|uniref:HET-domain-containing protein n=1 Tax=Mollisia scopiformis TaxID=149040 RepID=A0A194XMV4_MOLSC|nr:HET-domain-containing protein [Mollisia scopiformis]KUJ21488.1 HET-domain-containing protein [Mollisia scopiformis]